MLIDVHAHIGQVRPRPECILDVEDLLRKMDAWEIDRSCVLALSEHPEANYRDSTTEDTISASSRYPDRLTPFCSIDPGTGTDGPETDFRDRLESFRDRGCRGLGEFVPRLPVDDSLCLNIYRQAGEFGLPVLFDMNDTRDEYGVHDDPGLPGLEHALRECQDTIFIGHGTTFWAGISGDTTASEHRGYPYPHGPIKPNGAVDRLMAAHENLWADISAGSALNALTRDPAFGLNFLKAYQDRLLFGTDSCRRYDAEPVCPNREFMRRLRDEGLLDDVACAKIESRNAQRLLGI